MGDEITYPFPDFNGTAIAIVIVIQSHFTGHMITHPCWD